MFFDVFILHQPFLLQKDQNWYQESWLGLVQNYEGSATSPNFWSFFIKHFDLRFRCPAGVINIEVVSMLHKTFNQKTLSWLLDVIFAATSFNPSRAILYIIYSKDLIMIFIYIRYLIVPCLRLMINTIFAPRWRCKPKSVKCDIYFRMEELSID